MNRKSQVYAIREIFQFGLGVLMLTAVIYMFYEQFIPQVAEYSLELEANNINSHINYLTMNALHIINNGLRNGELSADYSLPEKMGDYSYTTFFTGNQLCTLINELDVSQCIELNVADNVVTKGVFFSGGVLTITASSNRTTTTIILGN